MTTKKLQNLIQSGQDLNILIENDGGFESDYDITLAQTRNNEASPAGRTATSSTRTESDVLNINGWIRQLKCNGTEIDTTDYLKRMKKTVEAQKYTTAELATITNADGVFTNMLLTSVNWRRASESPQEILVSMTWESMNLAGTIDNPFFTLGGLTA